MRMVVVLLIVFSVGKSVIKGATGFTTLRLQVKHDDIILRAIKRPLHIQ